jgi:hypothetical protein
MPSSIQLGEDLRHAQAISLAVKLVKKNLKKCDEDDLHLAVKCFDQLRWKLDKIPMTRDERMEFDDMIAATGKVLGHNN